MLASSTSPNYYDDLEARYAFGRGELELLASNNVLYDRHGDAEFLHAYLLPAGDFSIELVSAGKATTDLALPTPPSARGQTPRSDAAAADGRLMAAGAFHVALIGDGVRESLTPALHEAEAAELGLDYRYDVVDLLDPQRSAADIAHVLAEVEAAGYDAANVTHPIKQTVIPLLDGLSEQANNVGAVEPGAIP